MKRTKHLPAISLAALLAACLAALYLTRDTGASRIVPKDKAKSAQASLVDSRLLDSARRIAAFASTSSEQDLAREALRVADHELDLAFATALREVTQTTASPSPEVVAITARIARVKARIEAEQASLAQLTKAAAGKDSAPDRLDLVKAQLELDQDKLDDAQQDLARSGGDRRSAIQRELDAHEASHSQPVAMPNVTKESLTTLKDQVQSWIFWNAKGAGVEEVRQQAAAYASSLERQHEALEAASTGKPAATKQPVAGSQLAPNQPAEAAPSGDDSAAAGADVEDTAAAVDRLRRLSDQTKTMAALDKRVADSRQLEALYQQWSALAEAGRRAALHASLGSLSGILGVILAVVLARAGIRHFLGRRRNIDRGKLHQLRVMASIAAQLLGLLAIVLIVFGPPTQVSTMIGLATAGLTVVLKDFIVGFFGWFALMGRNGIRVGDWIEIQGVGGEVVEIGLLRTVLLEMGNWTATGHPTGRRVSFVNSFAIEGHFFNFSTAGQWLWDEIQVALPPAGDPYALSSQIADAVERETASDALQAEEEWARVTKQYGAAPFKAKPAVSLRPTANGLEAVVRYITRAPRRVEVKGRLFQTIIELLRKPVEGTGVQASELAEEAKA
jgi:hypothetical protein